MKLINFLKTEDIKLKWKLIIFKMLPITVLGGLKLYLDEASVIYRSLIASIIVALIPVSAGIVGTLLLWKENKKQGGINYER